MTRYQSATSAAKLCGGEALVTVSDVRAEALSLLDGVPDRDDLDLPMAALVELAVRASVTALDTDGIEDQVRRALDVRRPLRPAENAGIQVGASRCPRS